MTLGEKRKVIEVLLCAGNDVNNVSLYYARVSAGLHPDSVGGLVDDTYRDIPAGPMRFGDRMIEAAYRLIESSPTLRREWFGAP